MADPAGKSSGERCVLPRVGLLIVCVGFVGSVASCLLIVCEEEAAWFWALRLKNDENQLRFHLYLEILAQIFHAFHCHRDNGYAGSLTILLAKVSL